MPDINQLTKPIKLTRSIDRIEYICGNGQQFAFQSIDDCISSIEERFNGFSWCHNAYVRKTDYSIELVMEVFGHMDGQSCVIDNSDAQSKIDSILRTYIHSI